MCPRWLLLNLLPCKSAAIKIQKILPLGIHPRTSRLSSLKAQVSLNPDNTSARSAKPSNYPDKAFAKSAMTFNTPDKAPALSDNTSDSSDKASATSAKAVDLSAKPFDSSDMASEMSGTTSYIALVCNEGAARFAFAMPSKNP